MNEIWQGITQTLDVGVPIRAQQILAQAPPPPNIDLDRPGEAIEASGNYVQGLVAQLINIIPE